VKNKKIKSKGKGRLKLTALIKFLDFSNINLSVEKGEGKRGRPPRSPEAMLKAFVVMVFKGYSERGLETFLRNYPFWSRLCGFEGKAPCHATFSNFKRRFGEDTLKKAMHTLVQQLVDAGVVTMKKVTVDSSALSTLLADTEAKWGHTGEGSFYGYKIHIACCADSELPVSISVTTGNVHDSTQCLLLMKGARSYRTVILYMIADTAYDSIVIYEALKEKYNIISVVPFNPRNSEKEYDFGIERLYYYDTSVLERIYKNRTAVERVNNIVTKELGLDNVRYTGLKAVTFQAYLTCITQLAAAVCAVFLGYQQDMRKISFFK
jgi:IS5 family transposase